MRKRKPPRVMLVDGGDILGERERTLKGDQDQHDIDEFGFGQVFFERSKSYDVCIGIC